MFKNHLKIVQKVCNRVSLTDKNYIQFLLPTFRHLYK